MEANNESKMQKLDYIESNVCFFSQSQPAIIHCHIHIHINIITKPTSSHCTCEDVLPEKICAKQMGA